MRPTSDPSNIWYGVLQWSTDAFQNPLCNENLQVVKSSINRCFNAGVSEEHSADNTRQVWRTRHYPNATECRKTLFIQPRSTCYVLLNLIVLILRDQVPHPCKTTCGFSVLYMFTFVYAERSRDEVSSIHQIWCASNSNSDWLLFLPSV